MDSPLGGSDRQTVHVLAVSSARHHGSVTEPSKDESLNDARIRLSWLGKKYRQCYRPILPHSDLQ